MFPYLSSAVKQSFLLRSLCSQKMFVLWRSGLYLGAPPSLKQPFGIT